MPKRVKRTPAAKPKEAAPDFLKGWQQIASFLGQPLSVAQAGLCPAWTGRRPVPTQVIL